MTLEDFGGPKDVLFDQIKFTDPTRGTRRSLDVLLRVLKICVEGVGGSKED